MVKSGRRRYTGVKQKRKQKEEGEGESLVFTCTSCGEPQLLVQGRRNILIHPRLRVGVCRECLIFSHSDIAPVDEEGFEVFCVWCSELGNLVCCDGCKAPFCEECISRNIGSEYYSSLSDCEEWNCFICNPEPIQKLREITKAVLDHQNFKEPSELLLEECTSVFEGDPDIDDSDREDIVKERLKLRRTNMKQLVKKTKVSEVESDDENEEMSDRNAADVGSIYRNKQTRGEKSSRESSSEENLLIDDEEDGRGEEGEQSEESEDDESAESSISDVDASGKGPVQHVDRKRKKRNEEFFFSRDERKKTKDSTSGRRKSARSACKLTS